MNWPCVLLYLAGISWTLFYDTSYAHQDKDDSILTELSQQPFCLQIKLKFGYLFFASIAAGLMTLSFISSATGLKMFIAAAGALFFYLHMVLPSY